MFNNNNSHQPMNTRVLCSQQLRSMQYYINNVTTERKISSLTGLELRLIRQAFLSREKLGNNTEKPRKGGLTATGKSNNLTLNPPTPVQTTKQE